MSVVQNLISTPDPSMVLSAPLTVLTYRTSFLQSQSLLKFMRIQLQRYENALKFPTFMFIHCRWFSSRRSQLLPNCLATARM